MALILRRNVTKTRKKGLGTENGKRVNSGNPPKNSKWWITKRRKGLGPSCLSSVVRGNNMDDD